MKNTGKKSEKIFDEVWKRFGKKAHCIKFMDSAEATGRAGKITGLRSQPSDRVVVFNGDTFFAEVKSTWDENRFNFSLLRATQSAAAVAIEAAGGDYYVFIHSLAHGYWYQVPYHAIRQHTRRSFTWDELEPYKWSLMSR